MKQILVTDPVSRRTMKHWLLRELYRHNNDCCRIINDLLNMSDVQPKIDEDYLALIMSDTKICNEYLKSLKINLEDWFHVNLKLGETCKKTS